MKKLSLNIQGGWAKDFGTSYPQRLTAGYSTGYNVHFARPNYLGDLSATPNTDMIYLDGTAYNGKVLAGCTDSNGVAWVITSLGTTYKRSTSGIWNYFDDLGAVTQGYVGMWTHIDNSNNEIIIQSYWQNGGGWIVDKINIATNTRSNLFTVGSNPFTTAQRVGIVGMNNVSYFTNGQYIGTWEPDINVYDQTRLNLGKGWTTTSVCNYGNYIAIVGYKGSGQARLWLWDGDSSDFNFSYDIGDYKATAVVNNAGQLIVFTEGKNATTKIKIFNGNDFNTEPAWERPTSMIGHAPHHNSVDFYANQIFFTNETGKVYSYGSSSDDIIKGGLNQPLSINVPTNKGGGICKNLQDDLLFIGGDNDDTSKTSIFTSDLSVSTSEPTSNGSLITRLYELPYNSTIETIKVYFSDFGDNYSYFSCKLYKGNSTTNLLNDNSINNTNSDIKTYYPIACNIPEVDSFYLELDLANCSIRNIEIYYSSDESGK